MEEGELVGAFRSWKYVHYFLVLFASDRPCLVSGLPEESFVCFSVGKIHIFHVKVFAFSVGYAWLVEHTSRWTRILSSVLVLLSIAEWRSAHSRCCNSESSRT